MNYMSFSVPSSITVNDIHQHIRMLSLETYTHGDVEVLFENDNIVFVFNNESSFIPGECAQLTFYVEKFEDGIKISSPEVFDPHVVNDTIRYLMFITFEYLALQCGVDMIDSDGIGEHPSETWMIHKIQPDDSMQDFLNDIDNQYSGMSKWIRKIRHYLVDNAYRWSQEPTPFV